MGCNRTPTEKEARQIHDAAARVVAEVGGGDTARAEQLVRMYGESYAKQILRQEQQAQQVCSNPWGSSNSSWSAPSSSFSFEQPVWASNNHWQQEADRQRENADQQRADQQRADQQRTAERQSRLGSGQYESTVDANNRVVSNEGWLKIQPGESPSTEGDEGKHRGHIIGKQFGGSGDSSNIISMDPRINMSFINAFEGAVAEAVKSGRELYMKVEVDYGADSLASRIKYSLFEKTAEGIVPAGEMEIDPNTPREYTLKQGVSGSFVVLDAEGNAVSLIFNRRSSASARQFSDPFETRSPDQWDS